MKTGLKLVTAFISASAMATALASTPTAKIEVLSVLNKISQQLTSLGKVQQGTQDLLKNYTLFQAKNINPATPFPGWQDVILTNKHSKYPLNFGINSTTNILKQIADTSDITQTPPIKQKLKFQESAFIHSSIMSLRKEATNSRSIEIKIQTLTQVLNSNLNTMNNTQVNRVRAKIEILQTQLSEFRYNQTIGTQKLLVAALLTHKNNGDKS